MMAHVDGTIDHPHGDAQRREDAAHTEALRFARERYSSEAHVMEMVDKSRAADNDAQHQAPRATLWHALIGLDDGRHAVVGVRDDATGDQGIDRDGENDRDDGGWTSFEVNAPTLGDLAGE
jgi:hypothetical protein